MSLDRVCQHELHPYNLGENICLRHPKSILSLLTLKIQLSHDNYLQILESGYPVISGKKQVDNLTV